MGKNQTRPLPGFRDIELVSLELLCRSGKADTKESLVTPKFEQLGGANIDSLEILLSMRIPFQLLKFFESLQVTHFLYIAHVFSCLASKIICSPKFSSPKSFEYLHIHPSQSPPLPCHDPSQHSVVSAALRRPHFRPHYLRVLLTGLLSMLLKLLSIT